MLKRLSTVIYKAPRISLIHPLISITMSSEASTNIKSDLASVKTPISKDKIAEGHKKSKKSAPQFSLKVPKGTKDWGKSDMVIREAVFKTLTDTFKKHGGETIDTPVFELREILSGKYGEDSKLIYNLEDQGGELTSLRYDLTVPFARYLAMNNIQSMKRYQIAKVYRRDQPAMTKGRMREFYQCDFDIAGVYDKMAPDAEVLSILVEGLTKLGINFVVKINHRKILDGIFQVCGVKEEDIRKISSAVDKLDKSPWEEVKKEMVVEKHQSEEVADKIGEYVKLKGSLKELIAKLRDDATLGNNESAVEGIEDMTTLLTYTDALGISSFFSFDLSLARGLDYYTGVIYEAVTEASAPPPNAAELKEQAKSGRKDKKKSKKSKGEEEDDASEYVGVGSIAAGGRYDKLVGMFAGGKKNSSIPCVGISFGIERLFSIIKSRQNLVEQIRPSAIEVFVMAFGGGKEWDGFLPQRMAVAKQLREAEISTEYLLKAKANSKKQFDAADKIGAPIAVILGQEEYHKGTIRVKKLNLGEGADEGQEVPIGELVPVVRKALAEISLSKHGIDDITALLRGTGL